MYSPWPLTGLHAELRAHEVVTDALCSSSDPAHDAVMTHYGGHFSAQVATVTTDALLGTA